MTAGRVLYRKYRPTKLTDVVGQKQVTESLTNALKTGKISHAYLFIGPRGTGKTSVARILAHAVNDFLYELEDSYLDIIEIDAASNTGVDNIRELREKAIIAPTRGKYKVYIIDEVHMLSKSAANALLKTLEEPPEHVIFILATTEANKVPITISSRTQTLLFQLADPKIMFQHLRKIADSEQIPITDSALKIVVRRGGGSFRDTLSLLDQVSSLTDAEITDQTITDALGLPTDEALNALLEAYAQHNPELTKQHFTTLINSGIRPETIASELIQLILARPTAATLPLLEKLPQVQPPFPEAKLLLALLSDQLGSTQPAARTTTEKQPASTASTPVAQPTPPTQPVHSTPPVLPKETPAAEPAPTTQNTAPAAKPTVKPETLAESAPEPPTPATTPTANAYEAAAQNTSPQPTTTSSDEPFDWDNFVERIHEKNQAIYMQLQKTEHEFTDGTLHIYPLQKFTVKILKKPENSQVLSAELNGVGLVVHELEDRRAPEDSTLSQISAIMGDVREVNGEMPF